ncbi:MAG TPA: hypothetical protein VH143_27935 [Kofleriaceae bacterium]|nr:hypothetical protein [Kofleriaceae bacterium]
MKRTTKQLDASALASVTGGAEPFWVARPAMSSVPSGFVAWSDAMRQRGLL